MRFIFRSVLFYKLSAKKLINLTSVKKLVYSAGTLCDSTNCSKFSELDCSLIEILAPLLKEFLVYDKELPQVGNELSKSFWSAISKCAGLKKLYFCRQRRESPFLFLNDDMRDCLKSLKIREFHAYNHEKNFKSRMAHRIIQE